MTLVLGPIQRGGGGVGAEGGDLVAAHRDGLRGGRGGIHGDDLAVAQDEVRGLGEEGAGGGKKKTDARMEIRILDWDIVFACGYVSQ